MAKKETIGIALEGEKLRVAVIETGGKQLVIQSLQSYDLVQSLESKDEKDKEEDIFDESVFGGDDDFMADLEDSDKTKSDDDAVEAIDLDAALSEDWDMTEQGVGEDFQADTNEGLLSGILSAVNHKRVTLSLNLPLGQAIYQFLDDEDYRKKSKKELQKLISEKLESIYNHVLSDDNYSHEINKDNVLLIASFDGMNPLLNIVDNTLELYPGKLLVKEIKPDELNLAGLVNANYEIRDIDYTCIIHIQQNLSRVIFMRGSETIAILPPLNEGSASNRVMKTIFSKILFELDRGEFPTIDRIILTGDDLKGKAITFLQEQFIDVQIETLQYDETKILLPEEPIANLADYHTAIAAAWGASGKDTESFSRLTLVPVYVQLRQQVFKIEWHGFLLLFLIASMPFIFNYLNNTKNRELEELVSSVNNINEQITNSRVTASIVDNLTNEFNLINQRTQLLDTLSYNTLRTSYSIQLLNREVRQINGIWIIGLQMEEQRIVLRGFSLHRDRIPKLSNSFHQAVIQQVLEREERGVTVYEFTMLILQVTNDPNLMRPEKVLPPDDLFRRIEIQGTVGTIRN